MPAVRRFVDGVVIAVQRGTPGTFVYAVDAETKVVSVRNKNLEIGMPSVHAAYALFGGESLPLVQHLIEDRGVSATEISELRRLLDRLEEERDDSGK